MNIEECLARLEQAEHETEEAAILREFYADANREPLEVLRKVLDAYWINCYSDDEREAIRQRAEALLAGEPAPERTEPDDWTSTRKDLAELIRRLAAKCPDKLFAIQAMGYLERRGLLGSPLRYERTEPTLTCKIVVDSLCLVARIVPLEVVETWTEVQREGAADWAGAVAADASDNEDVCVPPEPEWTKPYEVDFKGRLVRDADVEAPERTEPMEEAVAEIAASISPADWAKAYSKRAEPTPEPAAGGSTGD